MLTKVTLWARIVIPLSLPVIQLRRGDGDDLAQKGYILMRMNGGALLASVDERIEEVQIPQAFQGLVVLDGGKEAAPAPAPGPVQYSLSLVGGREAALRLGVHENTIRQWANKGLLQAIRLPGSGFRRFPLDEVERMRLEMMTQMAPAEPEEPRVRTRHPDGRRFIHGDDI
jgi:excisionase family DNA binding protein